MDCVIAGLPISAKEYIHQALTEAYGEGAVNLTEVDAVQLRSRVRMSSRNVGDVLVILDGVSSEKCKDIEQGLYNSDKYHEYTNDASLVEFLNHKYELKLEVAGADDMELTIESGSAEQDMIIEKLREQVADRDSMINNLKAQIIDLKEQLDDEDFGTVSDGQIEEFQKTIDILRQENLKARSQISDLEAAVKKSEDAETKVRKLVETISRELENVKTENNQLSADCRAAEAEAGEYKIKYSNASGIIDAKDREIEELRRQSGKGTEGFERQVKELQESLEVAESRKKRAEEEAEKLRVVNGKLKVDMRAKDDEIARLSVNNDTVELENELQTEKERIVELEKEIVDLQSRLSVAEDRANDSEVKSNDYVIRLEEEKSDLQGEIDRLKDKLGTYDQQLMSLNAELIQAKSTAEMLEKSTSRDTDVESMYKELGEVRNQYMELSQSVFGKMASYSSPSSSIMIDLIKGGDRYEHIRFVFAGSTESRKGTYRSLLDEFRGIPEEKIVIVDATCETCVDYVFEIGKVVQGINWFVKGGGIMPYLSSTCLPNVKVLSPGLGYINDCYFLSVDWARRLKELDNSGFNIVVFCGDISSMVGRILHETFASRSASMVYTHGNAIGARTLVTNLRGLSNSKESIMCFFEFNERISKFYDMVVKEGHECRVISSVGQ